jgi:hypothetical protein
VQLFTQLCHCGPASLPRLPTIATSRPLLNPAEVTDRNSENRCCQNQIRNLRHELKQYAAFRHTSNSGGIVLALCYSRMTKRVLERMHRNTALGAQSSRPKAEIGRDARLLYRGLKSHFVRL